MVKLLFLCLCLCHVTPAYSCGTNPLSRFRPLARMIGKDLDTLLNVLRDSNPSLYRQVQEEWRMYADCVGLVDTGYFKRSGSEAGRGSGSRLDSTRPETVLGDAEGWAAVPAGGKRDGRTTVGLMSLLRAVDSGASSGSRGSRSEAGTDMRRQREIDVNFPSMVV